MTTRIGFIGLGVMGYPMAGHLAQAGYSMTVFNRTTARAEQWVAQYGGQWVTTPAEVAHQADIVFTCVGNDDHLRHVLLGETGALARMQADSVLVDHTTASARLARELYQAARQRHLHFLDAPVSGGQSGAEQGILTVMVGGDAEPFACVQSVIAHYARAIRHMGPSGQGQLTKMVNQICIAGLLQGLAEGLHFAQAVGLDPHAVIDVIAQGAAQSWQMDHRAHTMIANQFEFGFAVDWMRKDLAMALEEARCQQLSLPVTALVDQLYADIQQMGGGRWDTSSLIARLRAARK